MTPERWRRIEDLYHAAMQLEGASRAEFLARSWGEDAELKSEIERMIAPLGSARSRDVRPDWTGIIDGPLTTSDATYSLRYASADLETHIGT